jgi:hypothetical protein
MALVFSAIESILKHTMMKRQTKSMKDCAINYQGTCIADFMTGKLYGGGIFSKRFFANNDIAKWKHYALLVFVSIPKRIKSMTH